MKVIDPGHRYQLASMEKLGPLDQPQILQFIKKRADGDGQLITVRNGTTNEDVIRVLIDRLTELGKLLPSRETSLAITKLEEALHWLEARTRDRRERGVEGTPAE